jgi:PAS domain S-box-containing protein
MTRQGADEQTLRLASERLNPLFLSLPVGVTEALPDGALLASNPCFCEMLGYRPDELIGRPISEFTGDADRSPRSAHS